jgi:hypothetical protein
MLIIIDTQPDPALLARLRDVVVNRQFVLR